MMQKEESILYQCLLTILSNMPVASYGLQAGWMSGAGRLLQSEASPAGRPLSDAHVSWMASVVCLAGGLGAPLGAVLADRLGRRLTLMLISVPQAASWVLKLCSSEPEMLLAARTLVGVSAGACFVVPPMYVREISSARVRGALGSLLMFSHNVGLLGMYVMCSLLDYYTILWAVAPLPFLHILLALFSLESPAYLVKKGRVDEATRTVAKLRGLDPADKRVETEVSELRDDNERYTHLPPVSLKSIYADVACWRALLLCLMLMAVTAFGGNFSVLMYAATLLQGSGVDASPELLAIGVGTLFVVGSVVSVGLIERVGRKPLFLVSNGLMTVWLGVLSVPPLLSPLGVPAPPSWLPAFVLGAVVFSYALGLAPIPYVVLSEVFSYEVRATLSGALVTYAWLVSFLQLVVFSQLYAAFGVAGYLVFCLVNLAGFVAAACYMPETRGCSLAEIQARLRRDKIT